MIVYWAESAQETYQRTFFTLINPQPDNQDELKKVFGNLEKNIWIDRRYTNKSRSKILYSWFSTKCGKIICPIFLPKYIWRNS